jgi:hypothetical protein
MNTQTRCANPRRAALVRDHGSLNGIDYLEVLDADAPTEDMRQRILELHLFKPAALTRDNIRFEGGVRVVPIRLESDPEVDVADNTLIRLTVVERGDFSTYTLRLVRGEDDASPPDDFDPQLSAIDFGFKIECLSDLDCRSARECPLETLPPPLIDYLAKDYAGFRRLILDRLSVTMPEWLERSPADMMVMLAEVLAYAADHLSYMQDAVTSEMYLDTARLRSSVHRHTRLLDYPLHEGVNARLWAAFHTAADLILPRGLPVLTRVEEEDLAPETPRLLPVETVELAVNAGAQVFELMADTPVLAANNQMAFYAWGDENCCLPRGATRATLVDPDAPQQRLLLRPGDVLIFEEVTTAAGPASRDHRHAVRLTSVVPEAEPAVLVTEAALALLQADGLTAPQIDALRGIGLAHSAAPIRKPDFDAEVEAALGAAAALRLAPRLLRRLPALYRTPQTAVVDPLTGIQVVEIAWQPDDALPFPLCLSTTEGGQYVENITVALGNVAAADHGRTLPPEPLPPLPADGPYRPVLAGGPLVYAAPFDAQDTAARAFAATDPRAALPAVSLFDVDGQVWWPQADLLASDRFAPEFVVELEDDGRAALRFGGEDNAQAPEDGMTAVYRVGGGTAGNIGADRLYHVVQLSLDLGALQSVRNPLPGAGGLPPEPLSKAKLYAPFAFRRQERAVTAGDYAEMAQRHPDVQRAQGTRRWTGSWYTQFVTVDRHGGRAVSPAFEVELRRFLERYRMAGFDLEVDAPRFVPLDIEMDVCVRPGSFAGGVHAALLRTFGAQDLHGGKRGFFHPDNFTFGQPVYLSRIVAAAMAVPGVDWVQVTRFQRWGQDTDDYLDEGVLVLGRLEVARLDNDPSLPENGRIVFNVRERREVAP